ncbi:MAG: NADP-dependent isocitrate dehydrogenase [bacterium]
MSAVSFARKSSNQVSDLEISRVKPKVTVIEGDGIGPECVASTIRIMQAAGAALEFEHHEAGAGVFRKGVASGVPKETIESIARTRVVLKGPLETPVGYGEKSANVTLRKLFETYGNIRPVRELPGVPTPFAGRGIDLVVVRENVEDLYAGIEHGQTPSVAQCLKIMSRKGCEKIVRLAFEVARSEGRRRVHCATKANIMKMTEGLLKRTFEEIAPDYPEIEASHIIIDNCAHQLARRPEQFDVIVTSNMNGDIISDLTSGLTGGLGFAPSANLGTEVAIFEAVHGSAPKYAGKNCINPTAVLLSGVLMLRHLGQFDAARQIEQALFYTLESGRYRTGDVVGYDKGCSTSDFTDAVIANLGRPAASRIRDYKPLQMPQFSADLGLVQPTARRVAGVDVFIESDLSPAEIGQKLTQIASGSPLQLKMISNRGTQVWPATGAITDCVNHFRCRFVMRVPSADLADYSLMGLLSAISGSFRWNHIEKLNEFDGSPAFTKAQGES